MAVQIPAQAIADAHAGAGDLWQVTLAIAGPESGWNPHAVGDGGCSFGYLQFYTCGGLGDGHSQAELFDGPSNMRLGAEYIRGRLNGGASLYDALQPWTTRNSALALYQRIQTEGIAGVGTATTTSSATDILGSPVAVVAIAGALLLLAAAD